VRFALNISPLSLMLEHEPSNHELKSLPVALQRENESVLERSSFWNIQQPVLLTNLQTALVSE